MCLSVQCEIGKWAWGQPPVLLWSRHPWPICKAHPDVHHAEELYKTGGEAECRGAHASHETSLSHVWKWPRGLLKSNSLVFIVLYYTDWGHISVKDYQYMFGDHLLVAPVIIFMTWFYRPHKTAKVEYFRRMYQSKEGHRLHEWMHLSVSFPTCVVVVERWPVIGYHWRAEKWVINLATSFKSSKNLTII